tara:strand:- start:459 stop:686 length:228 start_codon:yes stop_codon:yes gene_type:complete
MNINTMQTDSLRHALGVTQFSLDRLEDWEDLGDDRAEGTPYWDDDELPFEKIMAMQRNLLAFLERQLEIIGEDNG